MPRPSPGNLPNPGIESRSPALQGNSLPSELPGKMFYNYKMKIIIFLLPAYFIWGTSIEITYSFIRYLFISDYTLGIIGTGQTTVNKIGKCQLALHVKDILGVIVSKQVNP